MAATPSPNYSDQQFLAGDLTFQNRVRQSLIVTCLTITNEANTVFGHFQRITQAIAILGSPEAVATNANVIGGASNGGVTPLTGGNVAAQGALVTDAHIDSAITAGFNSFFRIQ